MYTEGRGLYRSSENYTNDYGVVEPSRFKRDSRYTYNYYTVMMDNMSLWNKYPKRSKSVIGASSPSRVDRHIGKTYIMLPIDGTDIGVCPEDDLWDSFSPSLDTFNEDLKFAFETYIKESPSDKWGTLLKQFEKMDEVLSSPHKNKPVSRFFKEFYNGNMLQACTDYLDPAKNGFVLRKVGDVLPFNKEVWWSTKTVMVSSSQGEYLYEI